MKIAITTASGHLGSAIINQLKQQTGTENLIGIARTPSKAKHLGIEIRKGDYSNKDDFDTALKGVDTLLLVSGMGPP
jgi:NAD(P)H dehydrogenase (quinone)